MNNRAFMALAVAIGLVVIGVAVFAGRPAPSEELVRAVGGGASTAHDAFARAGISASRACVFGPYSTDETIARELGFAWDRAAAITGIGMR